MKYIIYELNLQMLATFKACLLLRLLYEASVHCQYTHRNVDASRPIWQLRCTQPVNEEQHEVV